VRLKQCAYPSGGAARYLTAAQHALPPDAPDQHRPALRRGTDQYVRLARELTPPQTAVDAASRIAGHLPRPAPTNTLVPGLDPAQHSVLLEVARGHLAVGEDLGRQRVHYHHVIVGIDRLRQLEAQGLTTREPSAAPFFRGGPPRDRARLTALGIATLGAHIEPAPQSILLPAEALSPPPAIARPKAPLDIHPAGPTRSRSQQRRAASQQTHLLPGGSVGDPR
jgi:hypothetical protein